MFNKCSEKKMIMYLDKFHHYNNKSPLDRYSLTNYEKAEKYKKLFNDCRDKLMKNKIVPEFGIKKKYRKPSKKQSRKTSSRKSSRKISRKPSKKHYKKSKKSIKKRTLKNKMTKKQSLPKYFPKSKQEYLSIANLRDKALSQFTPEENEKMMDYFKKIIKSASSDDPNLDNLKRERSEYKRSLLKKYGYNGPFLNDD